MNEKERIDRLETNVLWTFVMVMALMLFVTCSDHNLDGRVKALEKSSLPTP